MTKLRSKLSRLLALVLIISFTVVAFSHTTESATAEVSYLPVSAITKIKEKVDTNCSEYFDTNVVSKLPETVSPSDEISVIVEMQVDNLLDRYNGTVTDDTLAEFAASKAGKKVLDSIKKERTRLLKLIKGAGIGYELGEVYETLLGGFEVTLKASDFNKLDEILSPYATLIIGEVYKPCEYEVVENIVDVYETGIFDSSSCEYQGDGVVVAVLDTGLDYTHTAFSVNNFKSSNERFTLESVSSLIGNTVASTLTRGLTGEDVYVNSKVPYAYDYADQDADVFPISSEHGTHVAGVIAGKDKTIIGVAPNAQLAIMKVFSDTRDGARSSALIAALEDCVILGVDVINMSLGSACGFTREVDKEKVNAIYDKIHAQGITLIASAANDQNATYGSDKNGSLGLTSNPDSGTVGSPSTYNGPLSVASVDGVKTPYMLFNNEIIYFTEASTNNAEQKKHFVQDVLKEVGNVDSYDFTYITVPGIGKSSDYPTFEDPNYYKGKIVLVKRGETTFEDKVRIALKEKGAAGIIIYNNVSGTINMAVGADIGAVCSITQDEGEKLAKQPSGTITISRNNVAGPFMSDFSSWGPTSDLKIKPEITAHGGEILSAIPGQGYERMSGTSMAAPNQAGAAALIRQYVIYSGAFGQNLSGTQVNSLVNQLMMSTADIVINKNGLPYAVRKQGAGLININAATKTASYITTYDANGNKMDKTKIELGDDKQRSGVYEMQFDITNITDGNVVYDMSATMMTEGVSTTLTSHDDTTVTQNGYLLEGTTISVTSITGGTNNGNQVSVSAHSTATVKVKVTLSEKDKQYIADSFKYGMYVEGFLNFAAVSGTDVKLNVPVLAFFGDWTEAPIFDEEYYDTNKDEINKGLSDYEKLMPDAYATRVVGGLYSDYISTLGTYYFIQDPDAVQIAASKEHISLSNQTGESNWTVNSIRSINAGLLRNVKELTITVTEDATGKVVFERTNTNQHKSFSRGLNVYASAIETEFSVLEHNLKNNTKYTVTVECYIDYGEKEEQRNVRNTFEFPLFIDFEAPVISDVVYRSEYDKTSNETHLYADISVYDNHYAMAIQLGQITLAPEDSEYTFSMSNFGKYVTPVYSYFNSTSVVTVELTDYVSQIKNSVGIQYKTDGGFDVVSNNNSYVVTCYDYAMNSATYEIRLPDEILAMYFSADQLRLSPNETSDLSKLINVYPSESWIDVLEFQSSDDEIASVVNKTVVAKQSGTVTITATGKDSKGNTVEASLEVVVLGPGDPDYVDGYTIPVVNNFTITGYKTNKAFYGLSSDEREVGFTGGEYSFGNAKELELSMYPSESVTLNYILDSFFPEKTGVTYKVGNKTIAEVTEDGTIIAKQKGYTMLTATVTYDGKGTLYKENIAINVKDPFIIQSIYLNAYKGNGVEVKETDKDGKECVTRVVEIPDDRGITTINDFAFSNYEYVEKNVDEGDIIDEEDPYLIKQHYIGDAEFADGDRITKVIIPEGVTTINQYAFAGMCDLYEVVLPSTLTRINLGAFYDCKNLTKINLEHVQFINEKAFYNCNLSEIDLANIVSIGNYTFENCKLSYIELPETSQSLGEGAFMNNKALGSVYFAAEKIKIGPNVFAGCDAFDTIEINAAVIPAYAFYGATALKNVTLGKDVSVIGEYAFTGTSVESFTINAYNKKLFTRAEENNAIIYADEGKQLVLAAPLYAGVGNTIVTDAETIATGAFCGNVTVFKVIADNVKVISNYAFAFCSNLKGVSINSATEIGDYAFYGNTALEKAPALNKVEKIGKYAFARTAIKEVSIPAGCEVDNYAFYFCPYLTTVTVGEGATLNEGAFFNPLQDLTYESTGSFANYTAYDYNVYDDENNLLETYSYYVYNCEAGAISMLSTVVIGDNVNIGFGAFSGNVKLKNLTLGKNVTIGDYAFYNDSSLTSVDLSGVKSIGELAFSGQLIYQYQYYKNYWYRAYELIYLDGEIVSIDLMYASYAPAIKELDISKVESIARGAFAYNNALTKVVLNPEFKEIPDYAFAYCTSLATVVIPGSDSDYENAFANLTSVGKYAFYKAKLTELDLSNASKIGDYAFGRTSVATVKFNNEPYEIGNGAFAYARNLNTAENLDKAVTIGASAFLRTALTSLDLSSAEEIGDYAFALSKAESVKWGSNLTSLGENPFYKCAIETYGRVEDIHFGNAVIGTQLNEDYDISDSVKVIGGVLYQKVPAGLELISYPMLKKSSDYTVCEGTTRISAHAFEGSLIKSVTLATTLKSIGHKAFYDCENLSTVTFTSYVAPCLEEEYDTSILTYDNLPMTGSMGNYDGIGISDHYMWNVTSRYNNFYYGANFSDYVGHVTQSMTMVAPVNGQYYDTFIFNKYFKNVVAGSAAMTDETKKVIEIIDAIPSNISLACESAVTSARAAYDAITSLEQKALITNYEKLANAESVIAYLKGSNSNPEPNPEPKPEETKGISKGLLAGLTGLGGVVLGAGAMVLVYFLLKKKKADL